MSTPECYDILCSIGDLIDQLVVTHIKISAFHATIVAERHKPSPSPEVILEAEAKCRRAGEKRVLLRDAINHRIDEAIRRGGICVTDDARTFDMKGI
jgi:hypothetical protein